MDDDRLAAIERGLSVEWVKDLPDDLALHTDTEEEIGVTFGDLRWLVAEVKRLRGTSPPASA